MTSTCNCVLMRPRSCAPVAAQRLRVGDAARRRPRDHPAKATMPSDHQRRAPQARCRAATPRAATYTPSSVANSSSAACIASAAPSAAGLSRTMPVAWKNRIVAITPALSATPAGQRDLRRRRRAGLLPRERRDQPPQRLAGQGHAEHALGGVEMFAAALQVQQQQAVAERIQHRRAEHAQQRDPSRAIQPPAAMAELHQQHAGEDQHADRQRRRAECGAAASR